MLNVKDSSFSKAPLEATASAYEPFFAKRSRMYPNSCSTSSQCFSSEAKTVQSTRENLDSISSIMLETISSSGIGSLLLDDYPESDSPYESDSDDDRLYIDLDPPANYQRRVSVNCFTTPLNKVIVKDVPVPVPVPVPVQSASSEPNLCQDKPTNTPKKKPKDKSKKISNDKSKDRSHGKPVEKPVVKPAEKPADKSKVKSDKKSGETSSEKSGDRDTHSERGDKEKGNKSRDRKRKKRRSFANKSSQTELEYMIPANSSLVVVPINLEQGKEVLPPFRRGTDVHGRAKRVRGGRGGMRDRMQWPAREVPRPQRRFEPQSAAASLCFAGQEPPAKRPLKRPRAPSQEEDDSDMDPPIRTVA